MRFLIKSLGANTIVDAVDGQPDLTGFAEPTLSILQANYEAGNYDIIPDPEPPTPEPPTPQWTAFNFALFTDVDFVNYGKIANNANPFFVPALVERYGMVAKEGLNESGFPAYWQAFCLNFNVSAEHRNEWATLAESFDLPIDFINIIRG